MKRKFPLLLLLLMIIGIGVGCSADGQTDDADETAFTDPTLITFYTDN